MPKVILKESKMRKEKTGVLSYKGSVHFYFSLDFVGIDMHSSSTVSELPNTVV